MREFVLALKAIFASWNDGEKLDFQGEFYTHTLMPPLFNPGPNPFGRPPIVLGGVSAKATEMAAEVADGLLLHPFNTARFVEAVTLPAVARGRERSEGGPFTIACQTLIVTGDDEREIETARSIARNQIAFYASTPAYRSVLEAEGWGDLQPELHAMTRAGKWMEMGARITDVVVERVAVVGTPEEVARKLDERYGSFATRIAFASPFRLEPSHVRRILTAYRRRSVRPPPP
jgi:probable F420-dependent oxidoreductase